MEVLRIFLLTTLQIWYCCCHVIVVRTIKCLKFNCHLNLTKSHEVWWLNYRPFLCNVEKFVRGGGAKNMVCISRQKTDLLKFRHCLNLKINLVRNF